MPAGAASSSTSSDSRTIETAASRIITAIAMLTRGSAICQPKAMMQSAARITPNEESASASTWRSAARTFRPAARPHQHPTRREVEHETGGRHQQGDPALHRGRVGHPLQGRIQRGGRDQHQHQRRWPARPGSRLAASRRCAGRGPAGSPSTRPAAPAAARPRRSACGRRRRAAPGCRRPGRPAPPLRTRPASAPGRSSARGDRVRDRAEGGGARGGGRAPCRLSG